MRFPGALLLAAWCGIACADGVPVWTVQGDAGRVHILGSVHLLQASDYPLPAEIAAAYEAAADLYMELDLDALDVTEVAGEMLALGTSGDGPTVRDALGEDGWGRASRAAEAAGIDLDAIAAAEPWLAALMVYNVALARAGFDPGLGVDQHLAARAMADGKPIEGLETLEEQLALFDGLPAEVQAQMLQQTLEDVGGLADEAKVLVAAWRSGDLEALAAQFEQDFARYPELERRIVAERNLAWLPAIEARLARPGDSLVVVGALHTVGPEGLPALLEARGYEVRRR